MCVQETINCNEFLASCGAHTYRVRNLSFFVMPGRAREIDFAIGYGDIERWVVVVYR